MKRAAYVVLALLFLVGGALLWDRYGPAGQAEQANEDDKRCEAIGDTPNVAVPPADRLWWKEHCVCQEHPGCGHPLSERWERRVRIAAEVWK